LTPSGAHESELKTDEVPGETGETGTLACEKRTRGYVKLGKGFGWPKTYLGGAGGNATRENREASVGSF